MVWSQHQSCVLRRKKKYSEGKVSQIWAGTLKQDAQSTMEGCTEMTRVLARSSPRSCEADSREDRAGGEPRERAEQGWVSDKVTK